MELPEEGFSSSLRSNALVDWFAKYDSADNLSPSYPEPLTLGAVLAMADAEQQAEWEGMTLGYAEGKGGVELRRDVAALYETLGPEHVLSCVPDEGIFLGLMALLKPGDEVIVTCPAYASLYEIAHAQGCAVRHWLPAVGDGSGGHAAGELWFDNAELRGLVTERTALVVVNFPHNPTGALPTRQEHAEMVEICRERELLLFSVSPATVAPPVAPRSRPTPTLAADRTRCTACWSTTRPTASPLPATPTSSG